MAPLTRPPPSARVIVEVHDSDSEPEIAERHPAKRQKTSLDHHRSMDMSDEMEVDIEKSGPQTSRVPLSSVKHVTEKNAHLKGRRRFNADLEDMKTESTDGGIFCNGYKIKKIRQGDEEGSIEIIVHDEQGNHILAVYLITSDTADYPDNHSFFSYSPDSDISPRVAEAVEAIGSGSSCTVRRAVTKLLASLGGSQEGSQAVESQDIELEDEGSVEDYDPFDVDDYGNIEASSIKPPDRRRLQSDFIETVGSGYRPGYIRFGGDVFALSISLPVIKLAESIPPRALMAWDRRLLSRSQNLTLLISGLHGTYPAISSDGTYTTAARRAGVSLTFKVGLTLKYKPGQEFAKEASQTFGLITKDAEDELEIQAEKAALGALDFDYDDDLFGEPVPAIPPSVPEEEKEDEGRFDRFSLSTALETLMDQSFLKVLQFRRKFKLGWSGAEVLLSEFEKTQLQPEDIYRRMHDQLLAADKEEAELGRTNRLPYDPLLGSAEGDNINLPLTAFSYLVRRLSLCTRYCIVCHNKLSTDYEALKPYVCDSKLCAYQYYSLNRGPSLEYEIIHNPQTVDLLVSIAHSAAAEGVIDEPLPVGMGLRVPFPDPSRIPTQTFHPPTSGFAASLPPTPAPLLQMSTRAIIGSDQLCDFDDLSLPQMRVSIAEMIDSLPPIEEMKKYLQRKVQAGKLRRKLKNMDPDVLPAAWSILRWCVASCTAYLEEITNGEEYIRGLDPAWRQFRFSVGAPDAEAKFKASVLESQAKDGNALKYPSLYAFHGSALRNWHSIIRHGLWYKSVANGRAYGHGVYLAKEGSVSMGHYAAGGRSTWRNSSLCPTNCAALAEIVNLPQEFVSQNPYFVIKDTHWIMCRYLLVRGSVSSLDGGIDHAGAITQAKAPAQDTPIVKLDPKHRVTMNSCAISIPDPSHQINTLLEARNRELQDEENDEDDLAILEHAASHSTEVHNDSGDSDIEIDDYDEDSYRAPPPQPPAAPKGKGRAAERRAPPADDWKHDAEWVRGTVGNLMPAPDDSTPSATMAVQRELRAVLREQESAGSLRELGWYMPPELVGDNLFQWIVEMHSFDPALPIAKDLKARNINSVIFEIRFPPAFPLSPPFFRIVTPRFLPFIQGGGGHVTGGGSICMDLLTSDGWLPSYSISAILLQIKLAISNLDPRPARLADNFHQPYAVHEALTGYKRAAATHGWQVPIGIERLFR